MASKNAIISSNRGGLPELNINNKTGFTCDYNDIDAYVEAILKLLTSEKLLERFKLNSYKQAQKYNIENIVPMYEAEYKRLIK
jgi:glycosyltransferase involved in cell wall biosynthesis